MQRLWIVGAGAVGGYIAVHLAGAGHDVHVIDGWDSHVAAIRESGLTVEEPDGGSTVHLNALSVGTALPADFPDVVVLACKIGELEGILRWLEDDVGYGGLYIATLNGLADADVAARVGAERVLGCIVSGFHGELSGPGHVVRKASRFGTNAVFRFGEVEGGISERARFWSDVFATVDRSVAVDDLKAERWTKLQYNAMTSALSAVVEKPVRDLCLDPALRSRLIEVGLEVAMVAEAKGVVLGPVCGIEPAIWRRAAHGDAGARRMVETSIESYGSVMNPTARSGSAQDRARGRASEVDAINGAVVREAEMVGRDAPANRALWDELVGIETAAGWRPHG